MSTKGEVRILLEPLFSKRVHCCLGHRQNVCPALTLVGSNTTTPPIFSEESPSFPLQQPTNNNNQQADNKQKGRG